MRRALNLFHFLIFSIFASGKAGFFRSTHNGTLATSRRAPVPRTLLDRRETAARARTLRELIGPTFVFVAGLEGTGHHLMGAMFDKFANATGGCSKNQSLSNVLAHVIFPNRGGRVWELQQMLAREATRVASSQQLVALNVVTGLVRPGMMSYPDWSANSTSPDVVKLQRATDAAGVSLRILVTTRGAEATLRSGCVNNHWSGLDSTCRDQALRLREHGQALLHQLRTLPRSSVLCVSYEDFVDHGPEVSRFLGQDIKSVMEETYRPSTPGAQNATEVRAAARLLENTTLELERFCSSGRRLSAVEMLSTSLAPSD